MFCIGPTIEPLPSEEDEDNDSTNLESSEIEPESTEIKPESSETELESTEPNIVSSETELETTEPNPDSSETEPESSETETESSDKSKFNFVLCDLFEENKIKEDNEVNFPSNISNCNNPIMSCIWT